MKTLALMNFFPITTLGIKSLLDNLNLNVNVLFSTNTASGLLAYLDKNIVSSIVCDIPYTENHQKNSLRNFFKKLGGMSDNVIIMTSCSDRNVITNIVSDFNYSIISTHEEFAVINLKLERALMGEEVLSPKILAVLNSPEFNEADPLDCLTVRERKMLFYLLSGNSVSEIARFCSRSVKTISAHKINIMKKLGVDNDIQLFSKIVRM
ncbi:helix-turn-helix domain-containing protein [Erwinia sp. AnSW2-5]|uniref:helix-turn-helix domain-containing protein n=1 Tax=Erwinia sp. AnSW2-5 TaxID=3367692 RepID=UPI00385E2F88